MACSLALAACAGTSPAGSGGSGGGPAAGGAGGTNTGAPREERFSSLPSPRQEHAVAAIGDDIYVIGGFAIAPTATVLAYSISSSSWRTVADFPAVLQHANAASVDGKLYVTGFYLGGTFSSADGRVFEYEPVRNTWVQKSSMPAGTERAAACVAVLDRKIYVFGGARNGTVADASVYDTVTDGWQALPPLPESREHCVAAAIGGKLYIASGRSGTITGFRPNTWMYDVALGRYEPKASIPTPRGGTAGAVLADRLYVFGGEGNAADPSGVFPTIEAYAPGTDSGRRFRTC